MRVYIVRSLSIPVSIFFGAPRRWPGIGTCEFAGVDGRAEPPEPPSAPVKSQVCPLADKCLALRLMNGVGHEVEINLVTRVEGKYFISLCVETAIYIECIRVYIYYINCTLQCNGGILCYQTIQIFVKVYFVYSSMYKRSFQTRLLSS